MTILGIDPGSQVTGFGVIRVRLGTISYVDSGTIRLRSADSLNSRLATIYESLQSVIAEHQPAICSVENIFVSKNAQSALKLGHARGASILAALHGKSTVFEYSAKEVKMSVVGNGNASKDQVNYMVRAVLGLKKTDLAEDEADALAVAICHSLRVTGTSKKPLSWKEYLAAHPERVKKPR